ncbi:MAG: histidine kinase [Gemmatimonadota bacterium]
MADEPVSPVLAASPAMRQRWRFIVLAWTIPASIAALQAAAGYALRGALDREWQWTLLQFPRWMTWALVTPAIFALARRWPLTPWPTWRRAALHLVAAFAIATIIELAWLPATLALQQYLSPAEANVVPLGVIVSSVVFGRLLGGAFTYAAVLAVATVLAYHAALRVRDVRASQLETQLSQAQLHALKMQVHPHFLFNTLHAITVLIRENPNAAIHMVTRLGDLLRLTLSRAHSSETSVSRELDILTQYLEIERVRFHDRLEIHYDVQQGALNAAIPDLILQPLAENAIKHGIAPRARGGRIDVKVAREGPWLDLEIRDNGIGLPNGRVSERIGLTTTRERLAGLYGAEHRFVLESLPGGGCAARIRIPYRSMPDAPVAEDGAPLEATLV